MSNPNGSPPKYKKPRYVFVIMAVLVFVAEIILSYFLQHVTSLSPMVKCLINASLLTVAGSTLVYIVLFRPMLLPVDERKRAEGKLQTAYAELEVRVEERTADLAKANEELQVGIDERKRAEEKLQQKNQTQSAINAMLSTSMKTYSLEEILERVLEEIISVPWLALGSKGVIFLVEDKPDELVMKASLEISVELQTTCARVPFGKCLCGQAASTKEVQFVNSVDARHEILYEGISPHGHYCVPIQSSGNILGVLTLYVQEGHLHNQEEEDFLSEIAANVLAGIIERKRAEMELAKYRRRLEEAVKESTIELIRANEDLKQDIVKREGVETKLQRSLGKLRRAMGGIIQAMALTLERRDPYTAGHQRRVAKLARAIADEMHLPGEQLDGIRMAATIHDLGKISVPAEILTKPSRLSKIEFNLIKTHSQVGYDILKTIEFPWPLAQIVVQHHERMDGSGYPSSLAGEDILQEARVLAVADVVEAMASRRPYRPALGIDKALEEISQNKGILYDPKVADACLKLFKEKGFSWS